MTIQVGDRVLRLHVASKVGQGFLFATERFDVPAPNLEIRYPQARRDRDIGIHLYRWRRPTL